MKNVLAILLFVSGCASSVVEPRAPLPYEPPPQPEEEFTFVVLEKPVVERKRHVHIDPTLHIPQSAPSLVSR